MNRTEIRPRPQPESNRKATEAPPDRRHWMGWMTGATWEALTRCRPWPTPSRVARAYRELYGRSPDTGPPGRSFQYSEGEILAIAAYLLERQQQAEGTSGCRIRRGWGR